MLCVCGILGPSELLAGEGAVLFYNYTKANALALQRNLVRRLPPTMITMIVNQAE